MHSGAVLCINKKWHNETIGVMYILLDQIFIDPFVFATHASIFLPLGHSFIIQSLHRYVI